MRAVRIHLVARDLDPVASETRPAVAGKRRGVGGLQREEAYVQGTRREACPERILDRGGGFDGDGAGSAARNESRCDRLDPGGPLGSPSFAVIPLCKSDRYWGAYAKIALDCSPMITRS